MAYTIDSLPRLTSVKPRPDNKSVRADRFDSRTWEASVYLSWRQMLLAGLVCLVAGHWCEAVDQLEEFNQSKRALTQQLHSKEAAVRIEAIGRLTQYPIADAVRLVDYSLADPDGDVQDAAMAALVKMGGSQEASDTLLAMAKRAVNRRDDGEAAARCWPRCSPRTWPAPARHGGVFR